MSYSNIGNTVRVRGRSYQIVDRKGCNDLGSKFWGKSVWTLLYVPTGERFTAFGKNVAGNSKLTPVS